MKIENKKQIVKMWGMFVKLMTMMPPMMVVQRQHQSHVTR